jgi:hypothetical protein
MISFNQTNFLQVLNNHTSVKAAADYSGYNMQYIRRLLRTSKLAGIKIGQMWMVDKAVLDTYIKQAKSATDQRFGSKNTD